MPVCEYFIAKTFAHLLGGLVITGVSVEHPLMTNIDKKPLTNLLIFLLSLPALYLTLNTEPGIYKYILFTIFCVLLGQGLIGTVNRLNVKGHLYDVMYNAALVFSTMVAIGIVDNQNLLSWGTYLYACLGVLIISFLISSFLPSEEQKSAGYSVWLSRFMVVLFALFIGFDVEVLKENAKRCKNPDYVNESINLYLDMINLFNGLAGSE
jgi:FtsH-binding integral membrane protein